MKKILLQDTVYRQMIEHGKAMLPAEACGLLSGGNGVVRSYWKMENEWESDKRFFVSKKQVAETLRTIKERNEKVIAIYHTHPTSEAVPSYYDMQHHPDQQVDMVISSFKSQTPITKWYQIQGSDYIEYPFHIVLSF